MQGAVGIVTHPAMARHDTGHHPENQARLAVILDGLRRSPLWDILWRDEAPAPASLDAIALAHLPDHAGRIAAACRQAPAWLDQDTPVSPGSYEAALLAAGAAIRAVEAVWQGTCGSCLALVRPPGHHATRGRAMGFCLFNNLAVAAAHARRHLGAQRVLILDWDVHHGNGTQDIFARDPSVLFVSLHQWPLYPGSGWFHETGDGEGAGYTVNVPLPPQAGDAAYALAFEQVVLPVAAAFRPDLVLVSAGFDAHWGDPLASMALTARGFWQMAGWAREVARRWAGGRVAATLEGGYNLATLPHLVEATLRGLAGLPQDHEDPGPPGAGVVPAPVRERIAAVRQHLARHWPELV